MEGGKIKETIPGITYSCYHNVNKDGEQFVPEHTLSFQIDGSLILDDGQREYPSAKGSFRFIRRNQLLKFMKYPPVDGQFKSISIYLDQQSLKDFSLLHGIQAGEATHNPAVWDLGKSHSLEIYIQSLLAYGEAGYLGDIEFVKVKINEGILLLLQSYPGLKDVLFDFSDPFKIDLEAFMMQNYHFNVNLDRFAYLTGRSLATFKRDFSKIFHSPPRKWLQQKRLEEAYYLLTKKGKSSSDIYLDLGFEDLTHFSHAFKKYYGYSPKNIQ
ncbi:AraC family transcriptional regulator [Chitinophaga caeni]|uniref:AraC family transcriptional regulator n=1 Tax=Chitinophaga caeni TaxID=2029983 RepID=A0A291QW21_9BACT|nr:AraC family transcriptional regulator [Chitinophaga caeni]ATL48130.1 AraC family transcriptional regulator [Chitinophaga caeni]